MADDTIKTRKSSESRATSSDISNDHNNVEEVAGGTGREKEIGGRDGPDPTRFGDWEKAGRCIDF
jgi:hypothetical protein